MISNTEYGWCDFVLGKFKGTPSYLTYVPMDLLDAFINYYENCSGIASFDEEGSEFIFVADMLTGGIYIIYEDEEGNSSLYRYDDKTMKELTDELVQDIEKDFEKWADFFVSADEDGEEAKERQRKQLREKLEQLKMVAEE